MDNYFRKVRDYLLDLNFTITHDDEESQLFVIQKKDEGINNMVIGCSDPILILEQHIFDVSGNSPDVYRELLKKNRDIVHGAFVLDDRGEKVIFRDTLQLENLDRNELEGSINSLSLLLSEYADEIIRFSTL